MYNADPELCAGPWYSRAWAWGREAGIFVGFFLLFPVWIMSDSLDQIGMAPRRKARQITCGQCGTRIESVEQNYDRLTAQHIFNLRCHGEVETIKLEKELLKSGISMELVDYVAFAPKPAELTR